MKNVSRYPRDAPGLLQFWLPQRSDFHSRYRNNLHLLLPCLDPFTILAMQKTQSSFAFLSWLNANGLGIRSRCFKKILQLSCANSRWILGYLSIGSLRVLYCLCCFEHKAGKVRNLHNLFIVYFELSFTIQCWSFGKIFWNPTFKIVEMDRYFILILISKKFLCEWKLIN